MPHHTIKCIRVSVDITQYDGIRVTADLRDTVSVWLVTMLDESDKKTVKTYKRSCFWYRDQKIKIKLKSSGKISFTMNTPSSSISPWPPLTPCGDYENWNLPEYYWGLCWCWSKYDDDEDEEDDDDDDDLLFWLRVEFFRRGGPISSSCQMCFWKIYH